MSRRIWPQLPEPARPGVSRTALGALQTHALLELGSNAPGFATRLYEAAALLGREQLETAADPAAYRAAVRGGMLPGPGHVARFAVRKRWMADAASAALAAGASEVAVLGAGFDTLGLQLLRTDGALRVVELDRPAMTEAKAQAVEAARIARPWPASTAVELDAASALEPALAAAGWRTSERALFVAEAVLEYLAPAAAHALLARLGGLAAPGSRLACTVRFGDVADDHAAAVTAAAGEPMRFRPLVAELPRLIERSGLRVIAERGGVIGRTGAGGLLVLETRPGLV